MSVIEIKPTESCKYDIVSLGEIMLRLDPGEGRIRTTRSFRAWEGGGEYNVARALRKCFGMRAAVVTSFADNEVGRLLEDFVMQGGVDASKSQWVDFDGVGRTARVSVPRSRASNSGMVVPSSAIFVSSFGRLRERLI